MISKVRQKIVLQNPQLFIDEIRGSMHMLSHVCIHLCKVSLQRHAQVTFDARLHMQKDDENCEAAKPRAAEREYQDTISRSKSKQTDLLF